MFIPKGRGLSWIRARWFKPPSPTVVEWNFSEKSHQPSGLAKRSGTALAFHNVGHKYMRWRNLLRFRSFVFGKNTQQ